MLPPEERREFRRARLMAAATSVFAERGYPKTTIRTLTEAAEMSEGSFYQLFGGKEECFLAAVGQAIADGERRVSDAIGRERSWPARVRAGLLSIFEAISDRPEAAKIVLVESLRAGPAAREAHDRLLDRLVRLLRGGRALAAVEPPDLHEEAYVRGIAWHAAALLERGNPPLDRSEVLSLADVLLEPYVRAGGR
jgi:AcrR family transcriptional regulator